jgi:hypothetical protein
LIKRVRIAAEIATWVDKSKAQDLASILKVRARSWWDNLAAFKVNKENWVTVKASFLKFLF